MALKISLNSPTEHTIFYILYVYWLKEGKTHFMKCEKSRLHSKWILLKIIVTLLQNKYLANKSFVTSFIPVRKNQWNIRDKKKRHNTLCKCKSNFILVRGECLCNTFLKKCVSGMTVFGYTKQVRTATIQVTFCSLVEQDETHSTPPNTHSCSPKLPLCCFGKGGGVGRGGDGGRSACAPKDKELSRAFLWMFQGH